ncbi:MAG: hypothetical protein L6Q76_37070 [Polyangiaceae bacterium]|nr:hypothetical protein [Polyangiaceae bacterium]
MANKCLKSKALLAAPIVATALFAPACEPRVYRNPGPPVEARPPNTTPTSEPTASPDGVAGPPDEGGRIEKQPDGTCLYIYPYPKDDCPPHATCNPGPPREPMKVKCPDGG